MITPDDIENRVFSLVRRGYDPTEVNDFLAEVATALGQAQAGIAPSPLADAASTPPPPPPPPPETSTPQVGGPDDFGRLGEEVAEILRQAHESVARLKHNAEADAALIRQNAQREADALRVEADRDRQAAAVDLEAARSEAARILAEVQARSDAAAESAAAVAQARTQEVIAAARVDARDAVLVQRNVRTRLEGTRSDIDQALTRLVEEDTDLFGTIDLTDATVQEEGGPVVLPVEEGAVPPPGQGPPTPPVPPPASSRSGAFDDLPYADDEGEDGPEDAPAEVDLRAGDGTEDDPDDDGPDDDGPDGGGTVGMTPPPPAPDSGDQGAARDVPGTPDGGEDEDDALATMVKNAVENALRRRKGDDSGTGNGA